MGWTPHIDLSGIYPQSPPAAPVETLPQSPIARPVYTAAPAQHSLAPSGGGYGGAPVSGGGGGGGGGGVNTGGFAGAASSTSLEDTPYAWMLSIPDVAAALNEWQSGGHTDTWLKAHIMGTRWYKETSESWRNWQQLQAQDPATAEALRQQKEAHVRNLAGTYGGWGRNGTGFSPEDVTFLTTQAMQYGWSDEQLVDELAKRAGPDMGGVIASTSTQINEFAQQYLVPMSKDVVFDYARRIASGEYQGEAVESYIKGMAKSLFPQLTDAIESGVSVRQFLDPYAQIAGKELGVNPQAIDWMDPKWSKAINQTDEKGNRRVMNLSDWQSEIRTNRTYGWDRTQNARESASDLEGKMLQRFGMI